MGKWATCTFPEGFDERHKQLDDMTFHAINDLWIFYGSLSLSDFANLGWYWSQMNGWACIDNCEGKDAPAMMKIFCKYEDYVNDEKRINFEKMCICLAVEFNAPRVIKDVEITATTIPEKQKYNEVADSQFIIDYNRLHHLCHKAQVSHSLNYYDVLNLWNIEINSSCPGESFATPNSPLSEALNAAIMHMVNL